MQRRRCQSATTNRDRHPNMNRRCRLEIAVMVEAVECGEAARGQGDRFDCKRTDQQAVVGRPRRILAGQPLLACRDIDLMLEIVVWDFPLRPCHGGSDRRAHGVEIKPDRPLLFRRRGDSAEAALDIGTDDRTGGAAAADRRKIDIAPLREPPRGRRDPRAACHPWHPGNRRGGRLRCDRSCRCRRGAGRSHGHAGWWRNLDGAQWRGSGAGFCFELGSNPCERNPDRYLGVQIDEDLLNLACLEDFDFDGAFLRLDHGNDVTALYLIAGLDPPLDQRAGLHVGTEGGHAEFDHGAPLRPPKRGLCGRDDLRRLRNRRIFEVAGVGDRHFFAAHAADRRVELPEC